MENISESALKQEKQPSITIGEYTISMSIHNKENIWIEHESGEGGEFSLKLFHQNITEFYIRNF